MPSCLCCQENFKNLIIGLALLLAVNSVGCILVASSPSDKIRASDAVNQDKLDTTAAKYKYFIIVDPGNETAVDSKRCHPPNGGGNSSVPCKSLDYAVQQFHNLNSVTFYLSSSTSRYQLNLTANFTGVDKIRIAGNGTLFPHVPVVECEPRVGALTFLHSENIELDSVVFLRCGAPQNSTSMDLIHQSTLHLLTINVGVYFYNCTNVYMHQVTVMNSTQATGVVMYDVDGRVEVIKCSFTTNRATTGKECTNSTHGGGGFAVEFPYCLPGDEKCTDWNYNTVEVRRNKNAVYLFDNSTFHNNFACGQSHVTDYGGRRLSSNSSHQAIGCGGGISFYLKGDAMDNSISFVNCRFSHNHAVWGGGIMIEIEDNAVGNTVNISGCELTRNHAFFLSQFGTGGGGILVATIMYLWTDKRSENDNSTSINIEKSNFTHNHASQGGAISLMLSRHIQRCAVEVSISYCLIERNKAQLGPAVYVRLFPVINEGYIPQVAVESCCFVLNSIKYDNETLHTVGIGTVYVNQVSMNFKSEVNFIDNDGSALAVVGAQVNFVGVSALFLNNSGLLGAGIATLGKASILVGDTTVMNFTNNSATQYGGAIYNEYIIREDLRGDTECFIHFEKPFVEPQQWTTSFIFVNNKAGVRGNAIFSTSILPCSYGSSDPKEIFCWNETYWDYGDSNCSEDNLISTNPHSFIRDNVTDLSMPIDVYPGFGFYLPITAYDDRRDNITNDSLYYAFISGSSAKVPKGFNHVASNYIKIVGTPKDNVTLVIQTEKSQVMHIKLNLTILECPHGFVQESDKCECSGINSYGDDLKCFSNEQKSYIQVDKWVGYFNNELYMSTIPQQYREQTNEGHKELPQDRRNLNKTLCGSVNRTGILCGECIPGYAVAVNSPDYPCVRCDDTHPNLTTFVGNLFAYVALTYGSIFILFLVIIFLNFKLTSSAAMGFVLYAQMVGSEVFSLTPSALISNPHFQRVETAYTTIYGIFNLNSLSFLMEPFCLNKNFNTLDVICLDYAIAGFPLVMIILIYLALQCTSRFHCQRKHRRMVNISEDPTSSRSVVTDHQGSTSRNTLVHAFSAFMFLSYTKFCLASMKTMAMNDFYGSNEINMLERRIALAGQWKFTDRGYLLPYGILAIFVFIFAVLLPPFLLLGPVHFIDWLIEKPRFNLLRKIWPSIAIHTFIDTFQGFYRPGRRLFGGVFVLFRLVVFISFSFAVDINQHYIIQQIAVSVLICLIAIFRPYANEFYNYVNILIFLNLSILNTLAIFMYNVDTTHFSSKLYSLQCILVWLPLIYIIGYAVWRVVRRRESYQKVKENVQKRLRLVSPLVENENLLSGDNESDDDGSDDDLFKRAKAKNRYRPPSGGESGSNAAVHRPSWTRSQSSDVTFTEVSGPNCPEEKLREELSRSTGDSGAGTGTGTGLSS